MTPNQQRLLELINTSVKKKTIVIILAVISGLLMGPCVILLSQLAPGIFGDQPETAKYVFYFGCFMTLILLLMPIEELTKRSRRKQVEKAVTGNKGEILWIYKEISQAAVSPSRLRKGVTYASFHRIVFGHSKGFLVQVQPGNKNVPELERLVQEEFPHCTFGYDRELAQRFKKNPEAALEYKTSLNMNQVLTTTVKATAV